MIKDKLTDLLDRTKNAYDRSEIKKNNWYYSICSTAITPKAPLIVGFNWGVNNKTQHKPQTTLPTESFINLPSRGSFSRIDKYLKKYFSAHIENVGQSNFCFFRSELDSQIKKSDLELCIPLFLSFLRISAPSHILCLSSRLRNYLESKQMMKVVDKRSFSFQRGTKSIEYETIIGTMAEGGIKFYSLPHPNYPMPKKVRDEIWAFCFNDNGFKNA